MLDGVLDTIPNDLRGSLGKEWKDVKDMCLDIVDEKTLTGRDVLGKSPPPASPHSSAQHGGCSHHVQD
jgi:hypothetical protein